MEVANQIIEMINDNLVNDELKNLEMIQQYIDENIKQIDENAYQKIIRNLFKILGKESSKESIKLFDKMPQFSILTYKKVLRTKYNSLWERKKVSKSSLYVDFVRIICKELENKNVSQVLDDYKNEINEVSKFKSIEELKSLLKEYKEQLMLREVSLISKKALRDFFNDFVVKSKEQYIKDNIAEELEKIKKDFISIDKDQEKYEMLKEQQFLNLLFHSTYDTNGLKKRIHQLFDVELDNNELRVLIHNFFVNNTQENYRLLKIDLYMDYNTNKNLEKLEEIRKYNRFKQNYFNRVKTTFKGKYELLIQILNDYKNIDNYLLSTAERALINEIYWPFKKSNSILEVINGELTIKSNNEFNEIEVIALKHTESYAKRYKALERCINMYCAHYSEKYGEIKEIHNDDLVFDDDNFILNSGNYIINIEILFNIIKNLDCTKIENYNKEELEKIKKILFDEGLLTTIYTLKNNIDISTFINYFDYFNIQDTHNLDFEVIFKLINVYSLCDQFTLALLTPKVCEKLINNKQFLQSNTLEDIKLRLEKAIDLNVRGSLINTSAVPYGINVDYKNVKIRRFNNDDPNLLTSGIDTNTCFKLSGNDNDFVFYTILSKNGLALKILDEQGNIIGRVSAFRHANVLFLNGVRLIDDKRQITTETIELHKNIYDALVKYGEEIIKQTTESDLPIDFVVCNKAGILESSMFDLSDKILSPHIVENPLDMYNDDWKNFIHTYDGISNNYFQQVNKGEQVPFVTDYGSYPAVLITSRDNKFLERKWDIKYDDPEAIYPRPRKAITTFYENDIEKHLNKIYAISAKKCLKDCNYDFEEARKQYKLPIIKNIIRGFIGEDWYMILNNDFSMNVSMYNDESIPETLQIIENLVGNISNYIQNEQEQIKKESK